MVNLVIFGGGGFTIELLSYLNQLQVSSKRKVTGIIDERSPDITVHKRVLGADLKLYSSINSVPLENTEFLIGVLDPSLRVRAFAELRNRNAKFFSLIHPTSVVSKDAKLGVGLIIAPFCCVAANSEVSDNVAMNIYSFIGHGSYVGKSSFIGPRASIMGDAFVGEQALLGASSSVCSGVKMGDRSKLSLNSTLTKNCPNGSLAEGVPAKFKIMFK